MTTVTTPSSTAAAGVPPMARRVRTSLSSRAASVIAIGIALFWTVPTFGLLLSSFRPENDIKTSGWWKFFTHPQLTLQNYNDVLFGATVMVGRLDIHELAA